MKVTVNKYLNARMAEPRTTAPNPYYHEPGTVLEIDRIVSGTVIEGNAIWYHSAEDDHYYWSGGFYERKFILADTHLHSFKPDEQVQILNTAISALETELKAKTPGYQGIGIGYKNDNPALGLALIIFVDQSISAQSISNDTEHRGIWVPVVTSPVSAIKHQLAWDEFPLKMGGSITRPDEKGHGSRGLLFQKMEQGKLNHERIYLLTCCHVLFYSRIEKGKGYSYSDTGEGLKACMPYTNNSGDSPPPITEAEYNQSYDYAMVDVTEWYNDKDIQFVVDKDNKVPGDAYTRIELSARPGMKVTAFGSVSGKQVSEITHINVTVTIADKNMVFRNVWKARKLSQGGDSGAPVINTEDGNRVVGYIIAGNDEYSVIMPLDNIIYNKNYRLLKHK
jgi:hypothetical protein